MTFVSSAQRPSKQTAISLYLQSVRENGIKPSSLAALAFAQKDMLEQKKDSDLFLLRPEFRRLFKVVLTGGVFDVIHHGHLHTLCEAKKLGDVLVVVVATDKTVRDKKNLEPMHSQNERAELVGELRVVDLAIVGVSNWQDTLSRVSPDVVVFGYDQSEMKLPRGIQVVKLTTHGANPNSKTGEVRKRLGL